MRPESSSIRIRVTVLLRGPDGRLCMVRHQKEGRRYWLCPGGGQDPFESLAEAAEREVLEEINVRVTGGIRFLGLRESFQRSLGRHIQFPIVESLEPDFSGLKVGCDERVEGIDFFRPEDFSDKPVFPAMPDDWARLARGEPIESFRTLSWVD